MKKRKARKTKVRKAEIGWKFCRANNRRVIVKLSIPPKARRVHPAGSNKSRASFVKVLGIYGIRKTRRGRWGRYGGFNYKLGKRTRLKTAYNAVFSFVPAEYIVGELVYPDMYDPSRVIRCSNGIHYHRKVADAFKWADGY